MQAAAPAGLIAGVCQQSGWSPRAGGEGCRPRPFGRSQIPARQGIANDGATLAFRVGYAAAGIMPLRRLRREGLRRSTKLFVNQTTAPVLDGARSRPQTNQDGLGPGGHPRQPTVARQRLPALRTPTVCSNAPGRGGDYALRRCIERGGRGYVLAVTGTQRLGFKTVADWLEDVPSDGWQRLSAGEGAKGPPTIRLGLPAL